MSGRACILWRRFFNQFLRPTILKRKARGAFMAEKFHVTIPRIAVVFDLSAFDSFYNLRHAFLHDPHWRKTQNIAYLIEIDTVIAAVRVRPLIYDPSCGYKLIYDGANLVNG